MQLKSTMRVSSPRDPAEREAESTATKIMRMAESPYIARYADSITQMQRHSGGLTVARQADGSPAGGGDIAAGIAGSGSGAPLPAGVRSFMEPRFGASFSAVRIHTGDRAAQLSRQVSAQAFTVGNQIFFGKDRFQPDTHDGRELIAHELTHTIQQGAVQQGAAQPGAAPPGSAQPGTAQPGGTVHRREDASVSERTTPHVQRLGISDALDYFADAANAIPGYRMFTIVLGVNPINMSRVDRSAANILRAVVEFLPGGNLITRALDAYGVFDRVGGWIEQQLQTLGISGRSIRDAVMRFLDSLGWRDIFRLDSVWARARRIFTDPIDRILSFARSLFGAIMRFIKDAILRPLAGLASRTRGWDLLCAVLGQNPITGEAVPRTAETLIGGFMRLIGQEEIWQNIQRGNAIGRAWAWFQGALGELMGFVRQVPQLFVQALQALEIADIVLLPRAFARVAGVFGNFIGNFLRWAGNTVWNLLEIIFSVVAPGVMVYLRRARAAFRDILRDPIRFIGNLVRAGIQGLRQFAANFLRHLRASLIGWLTGAMSGANIYIPQGLTLREIIKFVLSVLGLTWQNIRQKLVRAVGEPTVRVLETTFDIVVTLVTQGPAAAWEKIQESLSNLREMVMEQIMTFVRDRVIQAAITRLVMSLNPAGAFIQAIIAIYNTVMFFVERMRQIAQVAASVIDSLSAIASGSIGAAANRVEQTMAGLLTLVISFLARIAGLGRVSDAVTNVVNRVRQPIDRALDRVVDWIVAQARRLGRLIASGVQRVVEWWRARVAFTADDGQSHTLYFEGTQANARLTIATTPVPVLVFLSSKETEVNASTSTLDPTEKARILAAITEARAIVASIDQLIHPPNPNAPAPTAEANQVNQLVTRLSRVIKSIAINSGAVPRMTVVPGFSNNKATGLTVRYLFNDPTNHENGTEASAYGGSLSGAIPILRAMGVRAKWVAFHILNHRLGGMAVDSNLVPTSIGVNNDYKSQFETRLLTAYGTNSVLWMAATLRYRSDNPEFLQSVSTTSGFLKWDAGQHRWVEDDTRRGRLGSFAASVPLPEPEAIAINHIPADAAARSLIVRLTPMTLALLNLIADTIRSRRIQNKGELIGLVRANVYRLEPANPQRTIDNYIAQIQATPMTFE